jgi:precorrin-2/cobalt-factor-2 C20-methyltransferase
MSEPRGAAVPGLRSGERATREVAAVQHPGDERAAQPTLVGVGVGPGDPELVTVKAVRVLREADVIFVPVMAGVSGPGRAETTIRAHVAADRIRPVPFALNDTGGVTARRAAAWQAAAAEVTRAFGAGARTVAFGTIGDPNLYSTFSYLAQTVSSMVPGLTIETVPGITAMQDLAARSAAVTGTATVLAEGDEPLTLLPLTAGAGALRDALTRPGTVVGYKLGAAAGPAPAEVVRLLAAAGRLDDAVAGARLGLAGQDIRPAKDLAVLPAVPYLSTLIVPARRDSIGSSLARDSLARDSLARDSLARDSLARDTPASPTSPATPAPITPEDR